MDLVGMSLMIGWLSLLIVALNMGGDTFAWNSPVIIGLLVGTGVGFVAFVFAEIRASRPVVPMNLFVSWRWRNVPIMSGRCCPCF